MSCFVEIESPPTGDEEAPPERIECCVLSNIEPRCCGPLARDLNALLPLRCDDTSRAPMASAKSDVANETASVDSFPTTDHLKRIRRRPATDDEILARAKADDSVQEQLTNGKDSDAKGDDKSNSNGGEDATDEPAQKRPKPSKKIKKQDETTPWSLDMLVGSVAAVDRSISASDSTSTSAQSLSAVLAKYNLSPESDNFVRRSLPGRPAHTKEELEQWNQSVWPTLFYEEKTAQYKEEQKALTLEEVAMMKRGMQEAIDDALAGREQWKQWKSVHKNANEEDVDVAGVVVVDPVNGSVVSRASEERRLQRTSDGRADTRESSNQTSKEQAWASFPGEVNPLCTSALLAIQGVSRKEREVALGSGMESTEFRSGQVSWHHFVCPE